MDPKDVFNQLSAEELYNLLGQQDLGFHRFMHQVLEPVDTQES